MSGLDEFWQDDVPQSCECDGGWIKDYGFFPGGDPRNYKPDEESCRPEEIEAWEAACARWDAGDETDEGASGKAIDLPGGGVALACGHRFGIGVYTLPCFDKACAWKRGKP